MLDSIGVIEVVLVLVVLPLCQHLTVARVAGALSTERLLTCLRTCGLTLLPLVLLALRNRPLAWRAAAGATAVIVGAVTAMSLLDLGVNGCPQGQTRAVVSDDGFSPGTATCSGDRDALRASR